MAIFDLLREERVYPAIRAGGLRDQTHVAVEEHHVIRREQRDVFPVAQEKIGRSGQRELED